MTAPAPLRVSLQTGCLFRHDAISNSLLSKLDAIAEARETGAPVDGRALVSYTEVERPDVLVAPGAVGLLEHPWFRHADICIYEFGVWYEAFDTVFAVPPGVATVATYHGVTPPELGRTAGHRRLLERSCGKKPNLCRFDHVMCHSAFCRDELLEIGIDASQLSVVPLPSSRPMSPEERTVPAPGAAVELLYVGRFVQAKGVIDLLHATRAASALVAFPFHLRMVGNEQLSDPEIVAEARRMATSPDLAGVVTFVGEVDDEQLRALYLVTDALVLPSYHEGYCVPVVEAVSAGAHVIASDAGNLPTIVEGVGRTVPAGDVAALAGAIADLVARLARAGRGHPLEVVTDRGLVDEATWKAATQEFRVRHSDDVFTEGFWAAVSSALAAAGREAPDWMSSV